MSKWLVDIHGELEGDYELICKAESTVSLDKVKQAREEIEQNAYPIVYGTNNHDMGMTLNGIFQALDKLIESEGEHD